MPPVRRLPLPDPGCRWTASRKAEVVDAVLCGRLDMATALERYKLSEEEFNLWDKAILAHGVRGLRVTYLKDHR